MLFDLAGLPDALAGPVILTLVDFIDRDVAHRRARHVAGHSRERGPWAGRAFVAIDEAWKQLLTAEAGGWLNEWARRTRHIACALLVITQHLEDFANPQGRALLRNSVLRLIFHTAHDELDGVRDALGYHHEDLAGDRRAGDPQGRVLHLPAGLRSPRPRDRPDLPLRHRVLGLQRRPRPRPTAARARHSHEAGGDAWGAMRLLTDPAWHHARAAELTAAADADVER